MQNQTHRANYGFSQWTSGDAKSCIRLLSNSGCIVQRVVLTGSRPAIRIKPDSAALQLGQPTEMRRGEQLFSEIQLSGCTVYWEAKS